MKLYEAVRSSASFRVRIALNLKGVTYESQVLDLRAVDHRGEGFAHINPQRAVPALTDRERTLVQSMAIVEYLEETRPEPPLCPRTRARSGGERGDSGGGAPWRSSSRARCTRS